MLIKKGSDISSSEITDERLYLRRREFMQLGAGLIGAAAGGVLAACGSNALDAASPGAPENALPQTPIANITKKMVTTTEPLNKFEEITGYNNYYEFGTGNSDAENAAKAKVEDVIKRADPTSKATFVEMQTVLRPNEMPGLAYGGLNWPYTEGLRMDEATNPLAFLAVGLYGKTLMNQNGAPIRLVVPWKYGFKNVKSIVHIKFVDKMPHTAWNDANPGEYGFYSNVNPEVDHPRWSQATERRIPSYFKTTKTLMFNGYSDQVASMYAGMDLKKFY